MSPQEVHLDGLLGEGVAAPSRGSVQLDGRLLAEDTHFGIGLVDLHGHLVEVLHERLELFGFELREVERHA